MHRRSYALLTCSATCRVTHSCAPAIRRRASSSTATYVWRRQRGSSPSHRGPAGGVSCPGRAGGTGGVPRAALPRILASVVLRMPRVRWGRSGRTWSPRPASRVIARSDTPAARRRRTCARPGRPGRGWRCRCTASAPGSSRATRREALLALREAAPAGAAVVVTGVPGRVRRGHGSPVHDSDASLAGPAEQRVLDDRQVEFFPVGSAPQRRLGVVVVGQPSPIGRVRAGRVRGVIDVGPSPVAVAERGGSWLASGCAVSPGAVVGALAPEALGGAGGPSGGWGAS